MSSTTSTSPMSNASSRSTLHVEDRGGAIYLEVVFGVVKYLDPRLVSRESYWVVDTIIQVGKWPLWSKWPGKELFLSFWNGLIEDESWLVVGEYFFDQVTHCSNGVRWVYILYHRPLNGNIKRVYILYHRPLNRNIKWVYILYHRPLNGNINILYHRPLNGNINGYIFCITAL